MEKIYSPKDEAELAVLRSLLDSRGIPHFVHNDAFGTILPGPHIDNYNVKSIMVPEAAVADARALIADFLQTAEKPAPRTSLWDRLRMLAEVGLFQWFVPGRHAPRSKEK